MSERFFNNAGPVKCTEHYCLPPLERFELAEIEHLIAQQRYFVLHAPRQTGKTTSLLALMDYLNTQGYYHSLYVNIEAAQAAREDVGRAMRLIVNETVSNASLYLNNQILRAIRNDIIASESFEDGLSQLLTQWVQQSDKPIVLMLDEVDTLIGDTLISLFNYALVMPSVPSLFRKLSSCAAYATCVIIVFTPARLKKLLPVAVLLTLKQNPYEWAISLKLK